MKTTRSLLSTLFFVLLATTASSQDQDGQLRGLVTGPFDGLVAGAPMRATHIASGESWQTSTDVAGCFPCRY